LLGHALAPRWEVIVGLGLLSGLGAGAIDTGLNIYAATHFSPRLVNWLHACYGIGATLGPVIMTRVLTTGYPWQWGYGVVGIWQLLLAGCFILTHAWWSRHDTPPRQSLTRPVHPATHASTLRLPTVWLGIAVFFLYTGLEAAAGAWVYSLLTEARGIAVTTAGTWVSVYWGGLTGGRLVSGLLVSVIPVRYLLRLCILGIALGAGLLWSNLTSGLNFLGLTLMGCMCAPIFPSLIATTPARLGPVHTTNGVGLQIAAAVLGQSLLPGLIGLLARHSGLEVIGPALFSTALLLLGCYEVLLTTESAHLPYPGNCRHA
jgi:fucose permease